MYGCTNTKIPENGISFHKIPFCEDDSSVAKARRKKWVDFVKLKRAKWQPSAYSHVYTCHFAPEDFTEKIVFAVAKKKHRQLIKDDIEFAAVPRFQRNSWEEEEELSHRSRRQVCNNF